jgi:N-methylhydantoinase A
VERGHDPRDFTLVPFGGAGPLHGCALAELLGISRVMIPLAPGVLCADGLLAANLKAEFSRTLPAAGPVDIAGAELVFAELEQQAAAWFVAEEVAADAQVLTRVALMRYHGQGGEIPVPWTAKPGSIEAEFAAAHQALYGFVLGSGVEIVTLRVEATGLMQEPQQEVLAAGHGAVPQSAHPVHFASGTVEVPVYDRDILGAGDRFTGPAIVTQLDATTVVPAGWRGEVHVSGAILLTAG